MAKNKPAKNKQKQPARAVTNQANKEVRSEKQTEAKPGDQSARNIIIAAVVILLILAGVGFLVLGLAQSLLNRNANPDTVADTQENTDANAEENESGEQPETETTDNNSGSTAENNSEETADPNTNPDTGSVNGDGVSTEARITKYAATNSTYRRGNDYGFGDIKGSSYVIKKGDTLWQIAEARYGSGYAWVDINAANGGFKNLRNGQPVLLPVGYNLSLPDIK